MNDILIVGGGVIGLSIARELARAGLSVSVLDRRDFGREASWAGAGILPPTVPGAPDAPLARLSRATHALWPELSRELQQSTGIDNGYRKCGGLVLGAGSTSVPELTFRASSRSPLTLEIEAWRSAGATVEPVSAAELREREPNLGPEIESGFGLPEVCQVRNPRHLQALLADCQRLGVDLQPHADVRELWIESGRVRGVATPAGRQAAHHTLIASGAWTNQLLPVHLAPQFPVEPVRGQMLLLKLDQPPFQRVIECGIRYLVAREDGRVLVGSTEERSGFDAQPTRVALDDLRRFANQLAPMLQAAVEETAWAGLRPNSPRGLPWIGPVEQTPGLYLAAGHFRAGLHLSAITARLVRQDLLDQTLDLPLDPFRPAGQTA